MTAVDYDFFIEQGADCSFVVQVWSDANHTVIQTMTGWTAKMQIKSSRLTGSTVYETLDTGVNGGLSINGAAGQVTVNITATKTGAYTWYAGVYDLEVYGPSNTPTVRVLRGNVSVKQQVTT